MDDEETLDLRLGGYYLDRKGREHGRIVPKTVNGDIFVDAITGRAWTVRGKHLRRGEYPDQTTPPSTFDLVKYVGRVPSDTPLSDLSG